MQPPETNNEANPTEASEYTDTEAEERYYDEEGELVTEYVGTDPETGMAVYKTHKRIY